MKTLFKQNFLSIPSFDNKVSSYFEEFDQKRSRNSERTCKDL